MLSYPTIFDIVINTSQYIILDYLTLIIYKMYNKYNYTIYSIYICVIIIDIVRARLGRWQRAQEEKKWLDI